MKLIFSVSLVLLVPCIAENLITYDEVERLVGDYMRNDVAVEDVERVGQVMELFAMPNYMLRDGIEQYSAPRVTLTCVLCRSVFRTLIDSVLAGQTDEETNVIVTNLCVNLGIESQNVCRGAVELNVPILTYIIRQNPDVSPNTFCGLVFQTIDITSCPFEDERFEWEVNIPPRPSVTPSMPNRNDEPPLTIALISDAHIDPLYEPYGAGDCGEPTCCRVGQTTQPGRFAFTYNDSLAHTGLYYRGGDVLLDLDAAEELKRVKAEARSHKTTRDSVPAGYWGDYRACDTPLWAFDDIVDRMSSNHEIDLIYYIGDNIDHGVWETTYSLIHNMNGYVFNKLHDSFPDVPIFSVIGNHESQPTNQFAPTSVTEDNLETQWLYDELAEQWGHWLPEEAKATVRQGGYFTTLVRPGLRVIGLNTNVAYKYNWWLVHDPYDSQRHLQWLVDTLYAAELAGERVHILSHIPPGVHDLTKTWTREYNKIITRFSSTITAEFNGHTHTDEFKVYYSNENGAPVGVAWNAGSMTSYTYYNVNYKILTVDSATYVPLDIETYMYNLTEANLTPNQRPHWFQLYDFRNTYGVTDLSAPQIDNLVHRMVTTEKHLLDAYVLFFHKLSDPRMASGCDDGCKLNRICLTVVTELWERQKCQEITDLYNNS